MHKSLLASLLILTVSCGKHTTVRTVTQEVTKPPGLSCRVYDLRGENVTSLPDFSQRSPVETLRVESLYNLSSNNASPYNTFVGTSLETWTEEVGMVCEGDLVISNAGNYSLYLSSDDGSRLYVNGVLAITNDGSHSIVKKGSTVGLAKGTVRLRVEYFNNLGDKALILSMKRPGNTFEELIKF